MTLASTFVYVGFLLMLVGIGATFGWPVAGIIGGLLMFVSGVIAEGREGQKR